MAPKKRKQPRNERGGDDNDAREPARPARGPAFPIVGIGASAGGLKALKELFGALPPDPGIAFVVIQHLDPTRESFTAEILAHHSSLRVAEVHDQPCVQPNCVYIIPPGKYLSLRGGELHLSEPDQPRGSRMAVDYFLRSLAAELGEQAVAVILSGTGTDGALGAKAVKEAGGLVIAQEPRTAEHDGMPSRAIETGVVDLVVAPEQIGEQLQWYTRFAAGEVAHEVPGEDEQQLRRLMQVVRGLGQRDFRPYKDATLLRRVRRRAALQRLPSLRDYVDYVEQHREEVDPLARDLLINVTRFFRDPEAWQEIVRRAVEPIVARRDGDDDAVRVWIPGCATGEEAYTAGLLLMEELRRAKKASRVQVFATDIAGQALDVARAGRYPQSIEADVPPELLRRYFVRPDGDDHYRVGKALREAIVFSSQDLLSDPPFSRLDLICCRNVLIYLKPEVQQKVVALFHFALGENGILFLGSAETIGDHDDSFETLSKRWRIFRRIGPTHHERVDFPVAGGAARREVPMLRHTGAHQMAHLAERWLLEWLAPAAVLINRKWRILYISGDVDGYLSRSSGTPSDDLAENLRKGLSVQLRGAVQRAMDERRTVSVAARVQRRGKYFPVSVVVRPVPSSGEDVDHLLILFSEAKPAERTADGAPAPAAMSGEAEPASESAERGVIQQLEDELATMRGDLRSTIEQLESSNEEYRAANEEVMSINEELRSTNEELETSKEELQSLNEELHTVNDQLATKVAELEIKNSDLENLQAATDIATICIDTDLRVRWFTPATTSVIRLHALDRGRPISDFSHDFTRDDLVATAEQVLRKLTPVEGEVECADGRIFMRRVTPYRTEDHRIGGVVATFIDISRRKRAEQAVHEARDLAEKIIDTVAEPMVVLDSRYVIERANGAFFSTFRVSRDDVLGKSLFEVGNRVWDVAELRRLLDRVLPHREPFKQFEVAADFNQIGRRTMVLTAQRVNDLQLILLVMDDITERKRGEEAVRTSEQRLRRVIETEAVGVVFIDVNGVVYDANDKFLGMTGFDRGDVAAKALSWQRLTPSEYVPQTLEQRRRLATTGRLGPYEKEIYRKDGSRGWMMIAGASLDDGTAVEFCIDVTSRKRAEHALLEGDRRKDEFLATLAHELRNPLAPLTTAVQVLRTSSDDGPTRDRMFGMMERQLSHLVRLVDDLFDVARVARGFVELRTEPVDVATVLKTAVETSSPRIEAAGRRLSLELPAEPMTVKADPVRLSQVVVNLLNNAASYTGRNGRIWLGCRREDQHAVIFVRDDGIGIESGMLAKVFEMFVQADRSHAGGLGIGLTLARSLVQLHGGTLEAYSDGLGQGSEFVVRLPLESDAPRKAPDGHAGKTDLSEHRVLVVDDNRDAADSLGLMLGMFGADVQIAYDGERALGISEDFRPNLVLLDIGMPGMDGYEVARQLRGKTTVEACTLVAVTGWGQEADRQRTSAAGFNHRLTKPVALDELLDLMAQRRPARGVGDVAGAAEERKRGPTP